MLIATNIFTGAKLRADGEDTIKEMIDVENRRVYDADADRLKDKGISPEDLRHEWNVRYHPTQMSRWGRIVLLNWGK